MRFGGGRGTGLGGVNWRFNGTNFDELTPDECWAFSNHVYGHRFGGYMNFYMFTAMFFNSKLERFFITSKNRQKTFLVLHNFSNLKKANTSTKVVKKFENNF